MPAKPAGEPAISTIERRVDPVAGVAWVTVAMILFAGLAAASRYATNLGYHPFEVVFLRNAAALLLMLPMLAWRGMDLIRSNAPGSTASASASACSR